MPNYAGTSTHNGFVFVNDGTGRFRDADASALPAGYYGSNTKNDDVLTFDIDGDGDEDVIISQGQRDPYYVGRHLQVLVNEGGRLVDQSWRLQGNEDRLGAFGHAEGAMYAVDVNRDGHLDLVDVTSGGNNIDAFRVFTNDGTGRFAAVDRSFYPTLGEGVNTHGQLPPFYPIDLGNPLGPDFVFFTHGGDGQTFAELTANLIRTTQAYWTGPNGINPADFGAPGFNEQFYLNTYADVAQAVSAGWFELGLAHYLAAGRTEGRAGSAPGTHVWFTPDGYEKVVSGNRSDYEIIIDTLGRIVVADQNGREEVHSALNRLHFDDGSLIFAAPTAAASVYPLYSAIFGRTPDRGGLDFWTSEVVRTGDISEIANIFIGSDEYVQRFGAATDDTAFLNALYQNILGRPADGAGLAFWRDALERGVVDRGDVAVGFAQSQEHLIALAPVMSDGLWVL